MGPYCKFCDRRCFVHLPMEAPAAAVKAYGSSTIIATCAGGQAFEAQQVGWNYDKIQLGIALEEANHQPAGTIGHVKEY